MLVHVHALLSSSKRNTRRKQTVGVSIQNKKLFLNAKKKTSTPRRLLQTEIQMKKAIAAA